LRATAWTTASGRYGLWLDGGAGHARLGEVVEPGDGSAGAPAGASAAATSRGGDAEGRSRGRRAPATVTRRLLGVDRGELVPGSARRTKYINGGTPRSAVGLEHDAVLVTSDVGDLPAWQVAADPATDTGDWAILVHGRSAQREECLRALPVMHRLGF